VNLLKSRKITVLILVALAIVTCCLAGSYLFRVQLRDLLYDEYAIPANDIKWQLFKAQDDYFKKHGEYFQDLTQLNFAATPGFKYKFGWRDSFPPSIQTFCPECQYSKLKYSLIFLENKKGYVYVWVIGSKEEISLVKRLTTWSPELF